MRMVLAWAVGIVLAVAVGVAISVAGDRVGVHAFIELRNSYVDDDGIEHFSRITLFGCCGLVLACLAGGRAGFACFDSLHGGAQCNAGSRTFVAWVFATTALLIFSGLVQLAFARFHGLLAEAIRFSIEVAGVVGGGWLAHLWWKSRSES